MRRRLRGLSERDWTVIDRLLVLMIAAVAAIDVFTSSALQGSPIANLVVLEATVSALVWRRSRPLLALICVMAGLVGMQLLLTPPPDLFAAVLLLLTVNYSAGADLDTRPAVAGVAISAGAVLVVAPHPAGARRRRRWRS
jgi:hypothetical protein